MSSPLKIVVETLQSECYLSRICQATTQSCLCQVFVDQCRHAEPGSWIFKNTTNTLADCLINNHYHNIEQKVLLQKARKERRHILYHKSLEAFCWIQLFKVRHKNGKNSQRRSKLRYTINYSYDTNRFDFFPTSRAKLRQVLLCIWPEALYSSYLLVNRC